MVYIESMNGVLGHDSALQNYTASGTTLADMDFGMNHARGTGLIARSVDQQPSARPLCYGCPLIFVE